MLDDEEAPFSSDYCESAMLCFGKNFGEVGIICAFYCSLFLRICGSLTMDTLHLLLVDPDFYRDLGQILSSMIVRVFEVVFTLNLLCKRRD